MATGAAKPPSLVGRACERKAFVTGKFDRPSDLIILAKIHAYAKTHSMHGPVRQLDAEMRARRTVGKRQRPAVRLNEFRGDDEAKAGAALFG
jgi:hypothetical protein